MELERSDIERIVRLVFAELMRLAEREAVPGMEELAFLEWRNSVPGMESAPFQGEALNSSRVAAHSRAKPSIPAAGSLDVLVLYADTSAGLGTALAQLRVLEERGCTLTHVLPSAAGPIAERVRTELDAPAEQVLTGPAAKAVTVGEPYRAVVVAALSRAEAAKVALVQTDTLFSSLVCQALWEGRPVVVARDGTLEWAHGRMGGAALEATVEAHLQRLATYGARVVPASELAKAVQSAVANEPTSQRANEPTSRRPVITAQEVEEAVEYLVVRPDAIITPLAWDVARKRGVQIRREAE
jgi:hypothetical protein